jgi:transcription elongation factor GreA
MSIEANTLTESEYRDLERRLADLEDEGRRRVAEAIAHARSFGDLSENFEYQAAKQEQALLESEIARLRARLKHAVVVPTPRESSVVMIGSTVEILDEENRSMTVRLSNVNATNAISASSPLGRALLGRGVGERVEVAAPSGAWTALIVAIS